MGQTSVKEKSTHDALAYLKELQKVSSPEKTIETLRPKFCEKCGNTRFADPGYLCTNTSPSEEVLLWECLRCGYMKETKTLDNA